MFTLQNDPKTSAKVEWKRSEVAAFWKDVAPSDHLVQIYNNDEVLLNSLEGFVASGFRSGDSVIVIADLKHLQELDKRLLSSGFKTTALHSMDIYIPVNAKEALSKFMINDWPDDRLFTQLVTDLMARARGRHGRKVRAYGEMVSVLWSRGNQGAAIRLENLWNKFAETEEFCLFCAYPKEGFKGYHGTAVEHICAAHSKLIAGDKKSTTEIFYRST